MAFRLVRDAISGRLLRLDPQGRLFRDSSAGVDCCCDPGPEECWLKFTRCACEDDGEPVVYVRCEVLPDYGLVHRLEGICYEYDSTVDVLPPGAVTVGPGPEFDSCEDCCPDCYYRASVCSCSEPPLPYDVYVDCDEVSGLVVFEIGGKCYEVSPLSPTTSVVVPPDVIVSPTSTYASCAECCAGERCNDCDAAFCGCDSHTEMTLSVGSFTWNCPIFGTCSHPSYQATGTIGPPFYCCSGISVFDPYGQDVECPHPQGTFDPLDFRAFDAFVSCITDDEEWEATTMVGCKNDQQRHIFWWRKGGRCPYGTYFFDRLFEPAPIPGFCQCEIVNYPTTVSVSGS